MSYTRFTVTLPEEEARKLERLYANSDFEEDPHERFRSNGETAEFVRYLISSLDESEDDI